MTDATAYKAQGALNAIMDQRRADKKLTPGGGGGPNSAWLKRGQDGYAKGGEEGQRLLYPAASSTDFYAAKRAKEKELGRTLATDEFLRDHYVPAAPYDTGTSIFDPVLTEMAYRWFCPPGGQILDPFAGGSVRGLVAGLLNRRYLGIDLRPEQVAANEAQARDVIPAEGGLPMPEWLAGDSAGLETLLPEGWEADCIFSCPPYHDLEVYSDDPRDISNMSWDDFTAAYAKIIRASVARLKPDRFAVWVIGDVRGPDGWLRRLPDLTTSLFEMAGAHLYNDAILVTMVGSLPIRAARQFVSGRKLGRTHQQVLIFVKGDWKAATKAVGPVDFGADERGQDGLVMLAQAAPDADAPPADNTPDLTPVEQRGAVWVKRDDLFSLAGIRGGKVRTCWTLASAGPPPAGLITAGARTSPQVAIVARLGAKLGLPVRCHVPAGEPGPELQDAMAHGAELVPHRPGYNSVIVARAREDAEASGWREIPFGMECAEAVEATASQARELPDGIRRIVVPVGSGMSLAGILHGLERAGLDLPVLGVVVGADPIERLERWAPAGWRDRVSLASAGLDYHEPAPDLFLHGLRLDPYYEAKAIPFLEDGDLLWVVGIRASIGGARGNPSPEGSEAQDGGGFAGREDAAQAGPLVMGEGVRDPDLSVVPERIKISAKWLAGRHDCTLAGILARCGGACCRAGPQGAYWPGRAGQRDDGGCHWLGPQGCTLKDADKPATCLLYPTKLNKAGTLVKHHRTTSTASCCAGNHGIGPPLVEAVFENLVELFGRDVAEHIRTEVLAGRDTVVEVPHRIRVALANEARWDEENAVPMPRSLYT